MPKIGIGQSVEESRCYVGLLSPNAFADEEVLKDLSKARELHKPVIFIVIPGTEIPEGFVLEGEDVIAEATPDEAAIKLIELISQKYCPDKKNMH